MNKKSVELAMNTIVIAMIVLVVALIIIFIFRTQYVKQTDIIGEQIDKIKTGEIFDINVEENKKGVSTGDGSIQEKYEGTNK